MEKEQQRVRHAVSKLSEDQKKIIQSVYFKGINAAEEEQQIPLGTVKGRVRLALRKLKTYLGTDAEGRADS